MTPIFAPPAAAQTGSEDEYARGVLDLDRLREDLDRVWRDLSREMMPAVEELAETMETLQRIDGLQHYEPPEILDNGDILLRRRKGAPPLQPLPEEERREPTPLSDIGETTDL